MNDLLQYGLKKAGLDPKEEFETTKARVKGNQMFYTNAMSTSSGTIIAQSIFGHSLTSAPAPDRWSAVTWYLWKKACEQANQDPSNLEFIFQSMVINEQTNKILNAGIAAAERRKQGRKGEKIVTEWTPDDDQFYALRAAPNGVGALDLAKDYPIGLGWKTIESISVYWSLMLDLPFMWVTYAPFCG